MTYPSELIAGAARGESLGPAAAAINWRRTLTLRERHSLLSGKRGSANAPRASDAQVEEWRSELSLAEDVDYERWLARHDWSDEVFRALVAPPVHAPRRAPRAPAWLRSVASAYVPTSESSVDQSPFAGLSARSRVFLTLAEPVARLDASLPAEPGHGVATWWTEGSPFVPPQRLVLDGLPDAATFAAMLHAVPGCQTEQQPAGPPGAGGVRE